MIPTTSSFSEPCSKFSVCMFEVMSKFPSLSDAVSITWYRLGDIRWGLNDGERPQSELGLTSAQKNLSFKLRGSHFFKKHISTRPKSDMKCRIHLFFYLKVYPTTKAAHIAGMGHFPWVPSISTLSLSNFHLRQHKPQ